MGQREVRGHVRGGSYVEQHSRNIGQPGTGSASKSSEATRAARHASLPAADDAPLADPAAAREEIKGQCGQLVHEVLMADSDVPWPLDDDEVHVKNLAWHGDSMRLRYLGRTAGIDTEEFSSNASQCSEMLITRRRAGDVELTDVDVHALVDFVDDHWDEVWERASKRMCESYTETIGELQGYFAARLVDEGKVRVGSGGQHEITNVSAARSMIQNLSEMSDGEDDELLRAGEEWPERPRTPDSLTMPPVRYDGITSDDIIIRDLVTRITADYDSEWFAGVVQEASERFGAGRMEVDRDGWFVQQRAREHWRAQGGIPFDDLLTIEPDAGPVNYRDIGYGIEQALCMRATEMVNGVP